MADAPSSTLPYTCNACLVAFRTSEAQRDHMRRDWHLYNVKRRVASLPPVSQEIFIEKVISAKASSSAAAAKASFERTCVACQKTFYSENSYQNHVKSSKHKQREVLLNRRGEAGIAVDDTSSVMGSAFSLGEPINKTTSCNGDNATTETITKKLQTTRIGEREAEENGDDKEREIEENDEFSTARCLFCCELSTDLKSNVIHMLKNHGMFIPEKDYLVDLEGLIRYLHDKITENNECLYCHAIRNTAAGVRTHMRDKGHCMIGFDSEEEQIEIGQFYDFTSTYSDNEDEDEDGDVDMENRESRRNGGVKLPGSEDGEEEGWETDDSSATSVALDDNERPYREPQPLYQTDYELHLPSGRSVGHRSFAKYYRQNLHNYPTAEERQERQLAIENGTAEDADMEPTATVPNGNRHRALITRANGGLGMIGATDSQKYAALTAERREQTRAQRSERRLTAKVNRTANKQKHFRDPLLQ